jgi:hypothetical protein
MFVMRRVSRFWLLILALVACSESHPTTRGPIDGDRLEMELTDDEYLALCTWWAEERGWPETVHFCDGGRFAGYAITTPEECLDNRLRPDERPDCRITVEAWYDCNASTYPWCNGPPPECVRPPECAWRSLSSTFNP